MTNLIIGDIAEGQKWYGEVEFLKQQLLMNHKANNAFMSTWKQLSSDVKVFIKMVAGKPQAFIYALTGGYNFSIVFGGGTVNVFNGLVTNIEKALKLDYLEYPVNIWHYTNGYVVGGASVKYANPRYPVSSGEDFYPPIDLPAVVYAGTSPSFTTSEPVNAAAVSGKYCYGITSDGFVWIWDISSGAVVNSLQIEGSWDCDDESYRNAAGYWSFNKLGTKACTVVWVSQYNRFNPTIPRTPVPRGWLRSFVVEIEFFGDEIVGITETETDNLCVAADYDWTEANCPIITFEYSLFSYQHHIAVPWVASTAFTLGAHIKSANGHIYEVTSIGSPPNLSGTTPPTNHITNNSESNGDLTLKCVSKNSIYCYDVWGTALNDAGVVFEQEATHNKSYSGSSDNGQWFQIRGPGAASFVLDARPDELKVKAGVVSSPVTGGDTTMIHVYGVTRTATSGAGAIPDSGAETRYAPNRYMALGNVTLDTTVTETDNISLSFRGFVPHVAAVPHPNLFDGVPHELAIYSNIGGIEIDEFWGKNGEHTVGYHQNIVAGLYDSLGPAASYRQTGVWAANIRD